MKEQLIYLDLEKEAEIHRLKQEQIDLGLVVKVEVVSSYKPSYGGTVVKVKVMNPNIRAPTIRKGESCCVEEHVDDKKRDSNKVEPAELSGVVVNVGFNKYDVHVAETSEIFKMKKKWKLVKVQVLDQFDDMENALRLIEKNETPLRDVLFGLRTPSQKQETQNLVFKNPKLDKSQKEAVVSAVHQNELSVIHGPPGTGKTTTIAEIVWQVTEKIIYDFVIYSLVCSVCSSW